LNRTAIPGAYRSKKSAEGSELARRGRKGEKEKVLPVKYKGIAVTGHRADITVEERVIIELKAVAKLERVFSAQLLS
jgi:GxxExxY protein